MLTAEGLALEEMAFSEHPTWVMEWQGKPAGFFTIRHSHGRPHLQHFCLDRKFRGHAYFRALAAAFKDVVRRWGFIRAIVDAPTRNEWLVRLIARYFKASPYAEKDGRTFFLVEV